MVEIAVIRYSRVVPLLDTAPTITDWLSAIGTDLAALGTVGALIFLAIQAARLGEQTAELHRQNEEEAKARRADEERRREQAEKERVERHFAQARLVAAVVGPQEGPPDSPLQGRTALDLINGSAEPVYGLVVGLVAIQGAPLRTLEAWLDTTRGSASSIGQGPITTASILPSGTHRVWIWGRGWSGFLSGRLGAEVAFTDRGGSHWIRRATGALEELDQEPFAYFQERGLWGPHALETPERLP